MSGAALAWIVGRDTGISSKTIWSVMMDAVPTNPHPFDFDIPHDPDDFGRCYRLLETIPEWRARLREVAARFPAWSGLVDNWSELEEMFLDVVGPTGKDWNLEASRRMYERMRELRTEVPA